VTSNMPKVGLILLAAGQAQRMGLPKKLLAYDGASLLRRAAESALASACRPVVVVTGANDEQIAGQVADLPLRVYITRIGRKASARLYRLELGRCRHMR